MCCRLRLAAARLAASGVYVLAFFVAEGGVDALLGQTRQKRGDSAGFGRGKREVRGGVPRDDVDGDVEIADETGQLVRVARGVVDAAQERPFKGELASGGLLVMLERRAEFVEGIGAVERDEAVAQGVVGGVERDAEADLPIFLGEAGYAGDVARGGDGDFARADAHAGGVHEEANAFGHVVVVAEGFAHAHVDDVRGAIAEGFVRQEDEGLAGDLRRVEIAYEAGMAGGAEGAVQRAAGLRGDADRDAVAVAQEHGLDGLSIAQAEQDLARAGLFGAAFLEEGQRNGGAKGFEPGAERLREIRHGVVGEHAPFVDPLKDLASLEGRNAIGRRDFFGEKPRQCFVHGFFLAGSTAS